MRYRDVVPVGGVMRGHVVFRVCDFSASLRCDQHGFSSHAFVEPVHGIHELVMLESVRRGEKRRLEDFFPAYVGKAYSGAFVSRAGRENGMREPYRRCA